MKPGIIEWIVVLSLSSWLGYLMYKAEIQMSKWKSRGEAEEFIFKALESGKRKRWFRKITSPAIARLWKLYDEWMNEMRKLT